MNIKKALLGLGALAKDNMPAILQGVSMATSVGALIAGCAGQSKADKAINKMTDEEKQDKKHVIKSVWYYYAPAVALEGVSLYSGVKSHKAEYAKFQQALLAASIAGGDKAQELTDKVTGKIKEDDSSVPTEKRTTFVEKRQRIMEPNTGFTFWAKPSDVFAAAVITAPDFQISHFITIADLIGNIPDMESDLGGSIDLPHSAQVYGWDTDLYAADSIVPVFKDGTIGDDGQPTLKLSFYIDPIVRHS